MCNLFFIVFSKILIKKLNYRYITWNIMCWGTRKQTDIQDTHFDRSLKKKKKKRKKKTPQAFYVTCKVVGAFLQQIERGHL